ncbi:MAG: heme-binding domain-containing protein [Anaerolineae bacterium]
MVKRSVGTVMGALVVLFLLIQLVPYGRQHTNPPVVSEPTWSSPEAEALARRACYDCHSNETVWPWYSNIAPFSWLVQHDVEEGRSRLNFSEWGIGRQEVREGAEVILEGEMPPAIYLPTHPQARLTDQEKELLAQEMRRLAQFAGRDGRD